MPEKPILFSMWAVQRILTGAKTATMRPLKRQPLMSSDRVGVRDGVASFYRGCMRYLDYDQRSPYQVGDILWIREAWRAHKFHDHLSPSAISDDATIAYEAGGHVRMYASTWTTGKLRPAMYLPKHLARPQRYEVLTVEARRPQNLTRDEIIAEGIGPSCPSLFWAAKWCEIYSLKSWEANPWSWRYTFREVKHGA